MHKVLGFATEFEPSSSTLHVTLGKAVSFLGLMCCSRGDGDVITRLPSLLVIMASYRVSVPHLL